MAAADFPVLGQPLAVRLLERALADNRLASAYLFAGPDGVGKRRLAEALTAVLLCGRTPACGQCPSCHKLASGTHPDRIEIRLPEEKKEIPVSEIRALQARMPYSPHEGQRRAVLVYDAENLSTAAANALLKTLEEPPARTHFVLTSSAPQSLLPTVRSRCQIVRFAPLTVTDLTTICLQSGASAEVSAVAAALAHGSAAKALAASAQEGLAADRARAEAFDRAASEASLADSMAAASDLAGDKGAGLERAFELLRVSYRDALVIQVGGAGGPPGEPPARSGGVNPPSLASGARALAVDAILARLAALTEAADRLDKNASPALVAEWVALRFRESRP